MRNFITKSLILYINLENNNLSGGMVVAGFEPLPVCKEQQKQKENGKNRIYERRKSDRKELQN